MRPTLLFAGIIAAGLASGCGSGGGGYPTSHSGPSQSGGTPTGTTSGGASAGVSIADFAFSPTPVTVKVGTVVTWTNYGGAAHTTTADGGDWDSGQIATGAGGAYGMGGGTGGSFSHTFGTAGTFTYHCAIHAQMTGTITVTP